MENSQYFDMHSSTCSARGELSKDVLMELMKHEPQALWHNASGLYDALCASGFQDSIRMRTGQNGGVFPGSTFYAARKALLEKEYEHSDIDYHRLYLFLKLLQSQDELFHVDIQRDPYKHLVRYFVGIKSAMHLLDKVCFSTYCVDAAHSKYPLTKVRYQGLQYHCLTTRSAFNTNILIAWSLDLVESRDSYWYLASQCEEMGFTNVLTTLLERNQLPLLISDGDKGTQAFADYFNNKFRSCVSTNEPNDAQQEGLLLYQARCTQHLKKSAKKWLHIQRSNAVKRRRQQSSNDAVTNQTSTTAATLTSTAVTTSRNCALPSTSFEEYAFRRAYEAPYQTGFDNAMHELQDLNPAVHCYFTSIVPPESWSQFHIRQHHAPSFGQTTNNCVEQVNHSIKEARKHHPFEAAYQIIEVAMLQHAKLHQCIREHTAKRQSLSAFAVNVMKQERDSLKQVQYTCKKSGRRTFSVRAKRKRGRSSIIHTTCMAKGNVSCHPCSTWESNHVMCRHMMIAVMMHPDEFAVEAEPGIGQLESSNMAQDEECTPQSASVSATHVTTNHNQDILQRCIPPMFHLNNIIDAANQCPPLKVPATDFGEPPVQMMLPRPRQLQNHACGTREAGSGSAQLTVQPRQHQLRSRDQPPISQMHASNSSSSSRTASSSFEVEMLPPYGYAFKDWCKRRKKRSRNTTATPSSETTARQASDGSTDLLTSIIRDRAFLEFLDNTIRSSEPAGTDA